MLSVIGIWIFPKERRAPLLFLIFVSILIVLPVYPSSSARAYIVSCIAIVLLPMAVFAAIALYDQGMNILSRKGAGHLSHSEFTGVLLLLFSAIGLLIPFFVYRSQLNLQWLVSLFILPSLIIVITSRRKAFVRI